MPSPLAQRVKTLALTTIVAGLVWLFAEGESLATRTLEVQVEFPLDPESDLVIRPDDPNFTGTARVRLEATARNLDAAAASVGGRVRLAPGTPGVPTDPKEKVVDLREAIGAIKELRGLGSSIADVTPRSVVVNVVRMVKRELPVVVEVPRGADQVALDGDPVASPATVSVRMSESVSAQLPERAAMAAVIAEADLRRLRADGPQTITVALRLPKELSGAGEPVLVSPEQVTVTLRLRNKVETLTLPTVPVWFSLPPTEDAGKWTITVLDKFLTDVQLSGPSDAIARLRSAGGAAGVKATLELSSDDLARAAATPDASTPAGGGGGVANAGASGVGSGIISRPVGFSGLPAGVTVVNPGVPVRVRVAGASRP